MAAGRFTEWIDKAASGVGGPAHRSLRRALGIGAAACPWALQSLKASCRTVEDWRVVT